MTDESRILHWDTESLPALPVNSIFCVATDSRGCLWIGTQVGLLRFDGAEFRHFTTRDGLPHDMGVIRFRRRFDRRGSSCRLSIFVC